MIISDLSQATASIGNADINNVYVTSSAIVSGSLSTLSSTKFGDAFNDTHEFTGSVFTSGSTKFTGNATLSGSFNVTGSQTITGSINISGSIASPNYIDFDRATGSSVPPQSEGRIYYDVDEQALTVYSGILDTSLQVGQETVFHISNKSGTTINDGQLVMFSGSIGNSGRLTGQIADQTKLPSSIYVMGVATSTITDGSEGFVTAFGKIKGINATGGPVSETWNAGDILYVHPTIPGALTNQEPPAGKWKLIVAAVVTNTANGTIFVRLTPGNLIGELDNISDLNSITGNLLVKSGSVWKNSNQLTGSYGVTGSLAITGSLIINGTTYTAATSGTSGAAGTSGTAGIAGSSGTSGAAGTAGTAGSAGTSGAKGIDGTSGTAGIAGSSGTSGAAGAAGTSGTSGARGTSGTTGTAGTAGSAGTSGVAGAPGTSGTAGISGTTGTSGTAGISGQAGGVRYNFSTSTADADPGSGLVAYNNGAIGSVNVIYIDNVDQLGNTQTAWYDTWDDSTNTAARGTLTIYSRDTGTIVNTFTVTGAVTVAAGYYKIPVSYVNGTLPSNGAQLAIMFNRTGNAGTSGTTGTAGTAGTAGTTGTAGTAGSAGTSGAAGAAGTAGTAGSAGTSGVAGAPGTSGTSGERGTSGTTGTAGTAGSAGTSGVAGQAGTAGTSGVAGAPGTSGTSGARGTSGTTGTAGSAGTSGVAGQAGTSGTAGISGAPGTSGTSGAAGTSGTGFNTISSAGNDRVLTSDGSSNSAVAETNLTYDGTYLTVKSSTATTNAPIRNLIVANNSTGTPAAGLGAGIEFESETSTTENTPVGYLDYVWQTPTNGSEWGQVEISLKEGGTSVKSHMFAPGVVGTFNGGFIPTNSQLGDLSGVFPDFKVYASGSTSDGVAKSLTFALQDPSGLAVPSDTTWMFTSYIVARRTDADNESAAYWLQGAVDNNAGTVALVGSVQVTALEDTAAWNATAVALAGRLQLRVTGETSKTIYWNAVTHIVQVSG